MVHTLGGDITLQIVLFDTLKWHPQTELLLKLAAYSSNAGFTPSMELCDVKKLVPVMGRMVICACPLIIENLY